MKLQWAKGREKWMVKRRKEFTTIEIKKSTLAHLKKCKITTRETYSEIIDRIIGYTDQARLHEHVKQILYNPEDKD